MFPVLLAEEDCSIKRGQPSITRDLPKSSSFLAEVFLIIYHYCYGVVGNVSVAFLSFILVVFVKVVGKEVAGDFAAKQQKHQQQQPLHYVR